jgi:excisionase family DNA binding protein
MATQNENQRLTLTVAEAAKLLGISRGTAYECVRTGEIPSVNFGRRVLIPRRRLEALLNAETPDNNEAA